jgi:hypothetical protein
LLPIALVRRVVARPAAQRLPSRLMQRHHSVTPSAEMKMARLGRAAILKGINMSVEAYLRSCRELNKLCSQNGWIDNDTLAVHIEQRGARHVVAR